MVRETMVLRMGVDSVVGFPQWIAVTGPVRKYAKNKLWLIVCCTCLPGDMRCEDNSRLVNSVLTLITLTLTMLSTLQL